MWKEKVQERRRALGISRNPRGIVSICLLLKFQSNFLKNRKILCFVVGIASGVMAEKTFSVVVNDCFSPAVEVVVVGFGRKSFIWVG
jgi:hypothetical protein